MLKALKIEGAILNEVLKVIAVTYLFVIEGCKNVLCYDFKVSNLGCPDISLNIPHHFFSVIKMANSFLVMKAAYEKAMRERTRLLKDGRGDAHWFAALEEQMAEHGVAIAIARRDAVTRLDGAMLEARGEFPAAHIAVEGPVERWLEDMPAALDVEDRFITALSDGRRRDQEAGRALLGPHLSDLTVVHLEKEMEAGQCSTGEQKLLLLALVIAQARLIQWERGRAPILLLDEVAAHLDEERRARLFGVLAELGGQCFMTGTDGALFEALGSDADFYSVIAGRLARKDRS